MTDLADRADVEALLRRFYGQVFADDVLAEPFSELREAGLESHLLVMCDFWETVLFRASLYRRNTFHVHRQLNERHPLSVKHFDRWLEVWTATVDQMYRGPVADHAKIQAERIAGSMCRRLTGRAVPQRGCQGTFDPSRQHRPHEIVVPPVAVTYGVVSCSD